MAPRFRIALTGGPGGGKTACSVALKRDHPGLVVTAPEVATMLFGGGFPRGGNDVVRKASQRAIYTVQRELETALAAASEQPVLLFDRGTVDASGYWVDGPRAFWKEVNSSPEAEFARYDLVVHLHTPTEDHGYNLDHHTRTESPSQAPRSKARQRQRSSFNCCYAPSTRSRPRCPVKWFRQRNWKLL